MIPSNWYLSNQAKFSVLNIKDKNYLVCFTYSINRDVLFVEDLETGSRAIPSAQEKLLKNEEMIEILISKF